MNLNLPTKLTIFFIINSIWSILITIHIIFNRLDILTGIFLYGFMIGILTLNNSKYQLIKSLTLGLIFLLIFIFSAIGAIYIDKQIFTNNDGLGIYLTTPIPIILIIFATNKFQKFKNKIIIGITMTVLGMISSYIGFTYMNQKQTFQIGVVTNLYFLWQTSTGVSVNLGN